jgi:hypothetical protein
MATKKKLGKKPTKSKKSAAGKPSRSAKKQLAKKQPRKKQPPKKQPTKKKPALKRAANEQSVKKPAKKQSPAKKTVPAKIAVRKKSPAKTSRAKADAMARHDRDVPLDSLDLSPNVSGLESGDLEGLSNIESADSESVDELLEEGNSFEAGVVAGVEDSRNREGQEVRTREVPEDDVPGEYLDPD